MTRSEWKWQDGAACRGADLNLFFPVDGLRAESLKRHEEEAKTICAGCEVRTECGEYAISRPEGYGTWGGFSADERRGLRRKRLRSELAQRNREVAA